MIETIGLALVFADVALTAVLCVEVRRLYHLHDVVQRATPEKLVDLAAAQAAHEGKLRDLEALLKQYLEPTKSQAD